ncbi:hypothetical protein [Pseudomonas viridiflava]|uniref:Uncharacterized protein n=1 Tax=Pseudomonas viridiflava TaxID=33069 RepID=A0A3M5PBQ9_PSEVI|nr:hypothetical protein [Pseudomonas viridiflava]RMT81998.1 hypothetical protein ALP40_01882 [Pseudomonas viridiflava]
MNIDAIKNHMGTLRPVAVPQRLMSEMGSGVAPDKAFKTDATEAEAKAKPFHEYQKEPWLAEPASEMFNNHEHYVAYKKIFSAMELDLMRITYDAYRKELADTHPEIASKNFSFTLDEDASLKIIDYDNNLTETEKAILTESINKFQELKSMAQTNAKTIMDLVDHDHDNFGRRYNLNIDNFHRVIDYAKLINTSAKQMEHEWVQQIQSNAETKSSLSISVLA